MDHEMSKMNFREKAKGNKTNIIDSYNDFILPHIFMKINS